MEPGERRWWAPSNFGSRPHTTTRHMRRVGKAGGGYLSANDVCLHTHTHTQLAQKACLVFMLKRGGSGGMGGGGGVAESWAGAIAFTEKIYLYFSQTCRTNGFLVRKIILPRKR